MTFKARFIDRKGLLLEYWRTIHADSINEALRIADKYTKKHYICAGVQQVLGKD